MLCLSSNAGPTNITTLGAHTTTSSPIPAEQPQPSFSSPLHTFQPSADRSATEQITSQVLNLSSKLLTRSQTKALELGLKFAPAPREVPSPLEFFENFKQRCIWAYRRVTGQSGGQPPPSISSRLDIMEDRLEAMELLDFDKNIPEDIRRATLHLKRDKNLTIRQADKGSCLVVQDTSDYIKEGLEHLEDTRIYKKVDHNRTEEVTHKANWICRHYSSTKVLSATKSSHLSTKISDVRTQQLYFLRKVHKNPHKIRPIVSCSSGPTEKLSGHLCTVLSAHLDNVHSLIRNSQQAVSILDSKDLSAHPDVMLVSLDVEALYLSIPQGPGIEQVLQRVVRTIPATSRASEYKNFLRDALRCVIRDNHFSFNESHYDQVRGVAMGTKCAPPFANLYLATLEERALEQWTGTAPQAWMRFLDDVLMLWTGGEEELQELLNHLNSQVSSIKFTMKHSKSTATFLDLEVYKGRKFRETGHLDTKLHIKATNPQSYLHFTSCHPNYIFSNIIRGEILRTLRATPDGEVFHDMVGQLLPKFTNRGYPRELFHRIAHSISFDQREYHLTPKPQKQLPPEVVLFSVPHHPALDYSAIGRITADDHTPFQPMLVRTRPINHGDLLVRARTRPLDSSSPLPTR